MTHEADCPYCGAFAVKTPSKTEGALIWQLPRDSKLKAVEQRVETLREALREIAHGAHSGRGFANRVLSETALTVEEELINE